VRNWKSYSVAAAVIASVAWLLSSVVAEPLIAQVRAALVKDVDNPSRQPFSARVDGSFGSSTSVSGAVLLTVPAGKRAAIEHLSCINFLDQANNWIRFQISYTSGGAGASHQFVHTFVGQSFASGVNVWSFSEPVRAYADPSTTVSIEALRRTATGLAGIECYASGHYVDLTP
jgi:hypothetical protein